METFVPSKDQIRSGKMWFGTTNLVKELELLAHRVNSCYKHAVPEFYKALQVFHKKHTESCAGIEAMTSIDPLLVEGRELLYNVQLAKHLDRQDPIRSMAAFAVFGDFQGGYLRCEDLGYRMRFRPGDLILLRGRVVAHEIEAFTGQRISIPHFTHTSCWRALGLESLVN